MPIQQNVNLRSYNSFHVPALARYFLIATDESHLQEALVFCRDNDLPFLLIGQGSNVLFRTDYPGLVIELNIRGKSVVSEDADSVLVEVNCGENWHDFVMYTLSQGWYGLENLALIPGTVGAAPVQNIGAYGVELSSFCEGVDALCVTTGKAVSFSREACAFGYRNSTFKQENRDKYIITSVLLRLYKQPRLNLTYQALAKALEGSDPADITPAVVAETVMQIRRSKLPDPGVIGNAGSFFWNPSVPAARFAELQRAFPGIPGYPEGGQVKIPAAWLIDQAGWKGYREGDVGVHRDHALVLVNYGEGSGEALCALAEKIQASVQDSFGIRLWPEVRIIGTA